MAVAGSDVLGGAVKAVPLQTERREWSLGSGDKWSI